MHPVAGITGAAWMLSTIGSIIALGSRILHSEGAASIEACVVLGSICIFLGVVFVVLSLLELQRITTLLERVQAEAGE